MQLKVVVCWRLRKCIILKVVAAVSSSEGYHIAAVEKYAALALEKRTAASGHNKTLRNLCACRACIQISLVLRPDQNKVYYKLQIIGVLEHASARCRSSSLFFNFFFL
ncbi:hypothetical protein OIU74_002889 [Salix koriyanagi]|uniref:Uncharacterized protein n=1 Tax=Salix koriyanagi TaxID=2511006 RepID=A0A9Q0X754_9ROSI|nr:hypothetical protein OIU74_002889 [Salix koriyanagi]